MVFRFSIHTYLHPYSHSFRFKSPLFFYYLDGYDLFTFWAMVIYILLLNLCIGSHNMFIYNVVQK